MTQENHTGVLSRIPDAPTTLYTEGNKALTDSDRALSIVGSRRATPTALVLARQCGYAAAEEGFVVVSGLAKGIDRTAHLGCLDSPKGKTIAVLGHGLDMTYPYDHVDLRNKILACDGLILTEYPEGTKPNPHRFKARNRLQSGLSFASIIIECEANSGTMVHVQHAVAQGRPVWAVRPQKGMQTSGFERITSEYGGFVIEDVDHLRTLLINTRRYTFDMPLLRGSDKYTLDEYGLKGAGE